MKNYLRDKRGNILLITYFVVSLMLLFGCTYLARGFTEIIATERSSEGARAFWAAETGIFHGVSNLNHGQDLPTSRDTSPSIPLVNGASYQITMPSGSDEIVSYGKSATNIEKVVHVALLFGGIFDNTLTAKNNIHFIDDPIVTVNGKTRYSGAIDARDANQNISDPLQQDSSLTSFTVADYNNSSVGGPLKDFQDFYSNLVFTTSRSVQINGNASAPVYLDNANYPFANYDLIYVQGAKEVIVTVDYLGGTSKPTDPNIPISPTIVSDSTIVYVQSGPPASHAHSTMDIISYHDVDITNTFSSCADVFAHSVTGDVNFVDLAFGRTVTVNEAIPDPNNPGDFINTSLTFPANPNAVFDGSIVAGDDVNFTDTLQISNVVLSGSGGGSMTINYDPLIKNKTKHKLLDKMYGKGKLFLGGIYSATGEWGEGPWPVP